MPRRYLPLLILILILATAACKSQSPEIVGIKGTQARLKGSNHLRKLYKILSPDIHHCSYYEFQLPDIEVIYRSRAAELADDYEHPGFKEYTGVHFTDLYFEGDEAHACIRVEDWKFSSKSQAKALLESIRENRSRPQFTAVVMHQFWFSHGTHLFQVVSESKTLDSMQMKAVKDALIRVTGGDKKNIIEIPTG